MVIINGDLKTIDISGINEISIENIYSVWKRWAITGNNMKYIQAFHVETKDVDLYILVNDWKIINLENAKIVGNYII